MRVDLSPNSEVYIVDGQSVPRLSSIIYTAFDKPLYPPGVAAARGTDIHRVCAGMYTHKQWENAGGWGDEPDSYDTESPIISYEKDIRGYVEGFFSAMEEIGMLDARAAIEVPRAYMDGIQPFACTPDYHFPNKVIVEFKTGQETQAGGLDVNPHELQVYAQMLACGAERGILVYASEDGKYKVREFDNINAAPLFRAGLLIWKNKNK